MLSTQLTYLLVASTLVSQADAPKDAPLAPIVGTWNSIDRHVAMGSLFQPVHGVRQREGVVTFRQVDGKLTGFAVVEDHKGISFQERWKEGRTEFRHVRFADNKLTFEFDIAAWRITAGPIAVEDRQQENRGVVRVEATLRGQRLVGKWSMFLKDGTEVFRGEWEARRRPEDQEKPAPSKDAVGEIAGTVVLMGGRHQDLSASCRELFFAVARGPKARIVVIPTAVANPESQTPEAFLEVPATRKPLSMHNLHTRDRKTADDPAFVKPLTEATAVFITNGHLHRLTDVYPGTQVERELKNLQARGGVIGGAGTGATLLGSLVIYQPHMDQLTGAGFGMLPKMIIVDEYGERTRPRFLQGLAEHPDHVGLMIDATAVVVLQGKQLRVTEGKVDVHLAPGGGKTAKVDTLKAGAVLDLVELRREASSRTK